MTKVVEVWIVSEYKTTHDDVIVILCSLELNSLTHSAVLYRTILFSTIQPCSLFLSLGQKFFLCYGFAI